MCIFSGATFFTSELGRKPETATLAPAASSEARSDYHYKPPEAPASNATRDAVLADIRRHGYC